MDVDAAYAKVARTGGPWSAEYRVVYPPDHPLGGETRWIGIEGTVLCRQGRPVRMLGIVRDVTQRKQVEKRHLVLLGELDHRVKNALAIVSVCRLPHARDPSSSMDDFVAALDGRIKSMATTHELLSLRQWQGLPLAELVRRELAPYAAGSNTDIEGPGVILRAEAGQVMAMVLHELVTNAAKYGALSSKHGRVSIRWHWQLNGSHRLAFRWQEFDGPVVVAPSNSGYGMSVIRNLIPYELGGKADLAITSDGVKCQLEIPGDWFGSDSQLSCSESALEAVEQGNRSVLPR